MMTPLQKTILAGGAAMLLWCTWMFRYDLLVGTPGGDGTAPIGYVLDRWTGGVHVVFPTGRRELEERQPSQ